MQSLKDVQKFLQHADSSFQVVIGKLGGRSYQSIKNEKFKLNDLLHHIHRLTKKALAMQDMYALSPLEAVIQSCRNLEKKTVRKLNCFQRFCIKMRKAFGRSFKRKKIITKLNEIVSKVVLKASNSVTREQFPELLPPPFFNTPPSRSPLVRSPIIRSHSIQLEALDLRAAYKKGAEYLNSNNPALIEKGLKLVTDSATQGHVDAQVHLGKMFYEGKLLPCDPKASFEWFKAAAEQGHVEAQYQVGLAYDAGEGVDKERTQAAYWMEKSARSGNKKAQCAIAHMYFNGSGVSKSRKKSAEFFKQSVDQGFLQAQADFEELFGSVVPNE